MSTPKLTFEDVLAEAQNLSPSDRLRLIHSVAETLTAQKSPISPRFLVYGEFQGDHMSTEEDFGIAEWRPTERDLNGA